MRSRALTAPPWAAGEKGLLPGLIRIPHNPAPDPSGAHGYHAISVSRLIDPNPYAAIPSLHAGYAFLCFLFVLTIAWKTRWRWWALGVGAIYPLAQSFAVVYTGNHYVVDVEFVEREHVDVELLDFVDVGWRAALDIRQVTGLTLGDSWYSLPPDPSVVRVPGHDGSVAVATDICLAARPLIVRIEPNLGTTDRNVRFEIKPSLTLASCPTTPAAR